MPLNLPTADPVTLHCPSFSHARVVIVYNTSVAYSLTLAQRYARRKRIPAANLFGVAMGTNYLYWNPLGTSDNATVAAMVASLRDLFDSVLAQAVLIAPGVPRSIQITGYSPGISGTITPATTGLIPLQPLLAGARHADDLLAARNPGALVWGTGASGNFGGILYALPPYSAATNGLAHALGPAEGYPASRTGYDLNSPSATHDTPYTGLNSETVRLSSDTILDQLGSINNRCIAAGRIGYDYASDAYANSADDGPVPSSFLETFAGAAAAMEQGMRYAEAASPGNRYQSPVHFQFAGYVAGGCQSLGYLHSQLIGWGYDSSYCWRQAEPAPMTPYTPLSGSAYTIAQLDAGAVRDRAYHLMIGDASNTEMLKTPYIHAWKPTGGAGSFMGPSEGWQYALYAVERQAAASGISNHSHVTTDLYPNLYAFAHMLLRGLSWAEAHYFAISPLTAGQVFAIGDPLARPFPR